MSALSVSRNMLRNVLHFLLCALKFLNGAGTILIGLREQLLGHDLLMLAMKQLVLQSDLLLRGTVNSAVLFGRCLC